MHDSLQETAKSSLQTVSATEPLHDLLLSLIDAGALSLKTVLLHYTLPNIQRGSAITSFLYQLFNLSSDDSPGQEDHRDLSRLGLQPRLRELFFDEAGIQLVCDMLADLCTTDEQNYERFVKAFCASALWRSAIDRHSYLLMDRCALQAEVLLTNQFAALPQDCAGMCLHKAVMSRLTNDAPAPWCFNELRMSMLCQAFLDPDLSPEESVEQIQKTLKGWISLTGYELVVRDLVKGSSPGQIQLVSLCFTSRSSGPDLVSITVLQSPYGQSTRGIERFQRYGPNGTTDARRLHANRTFRHRHIHLYSAS